MITHTKQEILDILKQHPYFVSFLQKNKLYFKYIRNAMNPKWEIQRDKILRDFPPERIINFSFFWAKTEEGRYFWDCKEIEYMEYYEKHNEI